MQWSDRGGTQILMKYPEDISISEKIFLQLYSTHEYSGEAGMISIMIDPFNIVSSESASIFISQNY